MDTRPRFCRNCPMIPSGIEAVLAQTTVITPEYLKSNYRFAKEWPEAAEAVAGVTRITAEVVASKDPDVEVGASCTMMVGTEQKGHKELATDLNSCEGPVSVTYSSASSVSKPDAAL